MSQWASLVSCPGSKSSPPEARNPSDVTVDFSREEWQHLDPVERCLRQDVTLETYSQLCAMGE
ncbi:hypothetical protein FD754_023331 [Muntiacus muntjak]|uniref:KRAB domain-containing protein n=1 Tax=Muntiacus muntjak TaxID=9888 RepID=A0A5N3UTS2_MUNMU|nr:hypothetical protein FD754_023331 [Muntiacus muntjak]